MLVPLRWIEEFVDLPALSDREIGRQFTQATCEVEGVSPAHPFWENVEIVELKKVTAHPRSPHLSLAFFEVAGGGAKQVVCGAPDLRPGMKVPFAPAGTSLPDGTLCERKVLGEFSEGMLCSPKELRVGEDAEGLLCFPQETPVGLSLASFLKEQREGVLEIDNKSLTHRPDLWGLYGMAREFATLFQQELSNPFSKEWEESLLQRFPKEKPPVTVKVSPKSANQGFLGCSFKGIKVESSPLWMVDRLESCGVRSINNIVDISNYVMLELGIPLHIFDSKKIQGDQLFIERERTYDSFLSLDGKTKNLSEEDTLVCDSKGPLSIAGVIGGKESGVTEETTEIFLEVANWNKWAIRKTSTRLGLRTESSQRYEKGLDSALLRRSFLRATELILQLSPGASLVGSLIEEVVASPRALVVSTSTDKICHRLGKEISQERIVEVLSFLGFSVSQKERELHIQVPSFRATGDIEGEADIIEEVGRIIGYNTIVPVPPYEKLQVTRLSSPASFVRGLQRFWVLRGRAHEVISSPLVGLPLLEKALWPSKNDELVLQNARSLHADRMTPSLIPSLLQVIAHNQKRQESFRFFEIGRAHFPDPHGFSEERFQLGVVFGHESHSPFRALRDRMEELFLFLNLSQASLQKQGEDPDNRLGLSWPGFHPEERLYISADEKTVGFITTVHPYLLRLFKARGNYALALLDVTDMRCLPRHKAISYKPVPRFPSSDFDCTVVTHKRTPVDTILGPLSRLEMAELVSVKIVEIFPLPDNNKSVTIRATFLDREKTLSRDFLRSSQDRIVAALAAVGFPLKE